MVSEKTDEISQYGFFPVYVQGVNFLMHKNYDRHHLDRTYEALKNGWSLVSIRCYGNSVEIRLDDTTDRRLDESSRGCTEERCWVRD